MPLPRESKTLDYSRWQQNLIGILQTDIAYNDNVLLEPQAVVTIDARLAYRNKGDADNDWKHYSSSLEQRELDCSGENVRICPELCQNAWKIHLLWISFSCPMNICTRVRWYRYSNWVRCIMITICWIFVCRSIRSVKWIWTLEIFGIYIWRWFIRTAVSPKFGCRWKPFSSHLSWPSCAGSGIVCINSNVHPFSLNTCCCIWAAHWHSWIVSILWPNDK